MGASQSEETPGGAEAAGGDAREPSLYRRAKMSPEQWPIVYSDVYNIGFLGLERIHPFDSGKWGKVFSILKEEGMLKGKESIVPAQEAGNEDLQVTHSQRYLQSLNRSHNVALVVEVPLVALLPNSTVQYRMLRPFRYQTGGTIMAGKLAQERGWAINIGGGFHHCSSDEGGGFCAYADITLCIKFMFTHLDGISKVMIVDFDAHQGNGHEKDFLGDNRVHILDMYNRWIYPNDRAAKAAINTKIELDVHTEDDTYLENIRRELPRALDLARPDMVVYNAGTDVLKGDPLGILDITPEGVQKRDEIVFSEVRSRGIPIVMVTSGGYQRNNAQVIADSILNLRANGLITSPQEDAHVSSELRSQGASLGGGAGVAATTTTSSGQDDRPLQEFTGQDDENDQDDMMEQ